MFLPKNVIESRSKKNNKKRKLLREIIIAAVEFNKPLSWRMFQVESVSFLDIAEKYKKCLVSWSVICSSFLWKTIKSLSNKNGNWGEKE